MAAAADDDRIMIEEGDNSGDHAQAQPPNWKRDTPTEATDDGHQSRPRGHVHRIPTPSATCTDPVTGHHRHDRDRTGLGRGRRRGEEGYSVLEAAIVLPAMIVLTMLVIQYALLWHGRHVAQAAAQDGLRAAAAYAAAPTAGQSAAAAYLAQVAPRLLRNPGVTVTSTATTLTVTVHAQVASLLAFGRFEVTEHAAGPRELFVAPAGDRP